MKIVRRKYPDCLPDSCKHSSVNRMAAGSRLPRSSHGFFFFLLLFKHTSAVNINILGLYKAFWYTGCAFTKYFNHDVLDTSTILHNIKCTCNTQLSTKCNNELINKYTSNTTHTLCGICIVCYTSI